MKIMLRFWTLSPLLLAAGLFTAASLAPFAGAQEPAAALPYGNDPEIIAIIEKLGAGESVVLPPMQQMFEGKIVDTANWRSPFQRDYCNHMAYDSDRQTAYYTGGSHSQGAPNGVWEYHLGSNTWHMLFPNEGGDHVRFQYFLFQLGSQIRKNPDFEIPENRAKAWEDFKTWWVEEIALTNGLFMTKGGGPLRQSHTFDTLTYDPINKRMMYGAFAYSADATGLAYVHNRITGEPVEDTLAKIGKDANGKPIRSMWSFDARKRAWMPYASDDNLAQFKGYGASFLYVDEMKKLVWYWTGGNYPGAPHVMSAWDPAADTWEDLKPNGVSTVRILSHDQKIAPIAEQQIRYSPKHSALFGVKGKSTYKYDIPKNEWSKLNDANPFEAHDAYTICAFDTVANLLLLVRPVAGKEYTHARIAAFDPDTNQWTEITPKGPLLPKPRYNVGKGYYDPHYNVFVVNIAGERGMWLYRHKLRP